MKIEEMCIKEGIYFRDILLDNHYCKLSYSGKKIQCKYLGCKDENDLFPCDYDRISKIEKDYKERSNNFKQVWEGVK